MRLLLLSCFAILTAAACASDGTTAPEPATTAPGAPVVKIVTSISKSRGTGPDANVKRDLVYNSETGDLTVVQPPSKGGTLARGAICYLSVSNNTRLYVQLYISGDFIGTLRPWADYSTTVTAGGGTLYGKAPFEGGSYAWWGPNNYNCSGQNIYWGMDP